jgi:Insecticidal Crystal Toxin, P42
MDGKIYRIVARHSGKVLDFAQVLPTSSGGFRPPFLPNDPLVARGIRQLIQFRDHTGGNQQFLLFPQDDGACVIATRDSGLVFDIAFASGNEETPVIEFRYNGGPNQSFILEPPIDNAGTHVVRAKHSELVLDVFGASRDDRTRVFQHHFKDGDNQKFTFEQVDSYPVIKTAALADPGVPPAASSINDNLKTSTDPALVGEVFLPYFLVNDDTLSLSNAIQRTPYYRMTRHQFWIKTSQFNFAGPPQEREYDIVEGLTKEESTEMEFTVGLSLSTEKGTLLLPPKDSPAGTSSQLTKPFLGTLTAGLKITTKTTTTTSTQTTVKRTLQFKGGPEMLFAEYVLVDRYTLFRADGVPVKPPWETKFADIFRQVVFPPQASSNVISRSIKVK